MKQEGSSEGENQTSTMKAVQFTQMRETLRRSHVQLTIALNHLKGLASIMLRQQSLCNIDVL